jgi:FdhD protein
VAEGRSPRRVITVRHGQSREQDASLPEEAVVRVLLNGRRVATLSASPVALEELAVGHLALEGGLRSRSDVRAVRVRRWREEFHVAAEARRREFATVSSRLPAGPRIGAGEVRALMRALMEGAALYREGGGVHTSALATPLAVRFLAADVGKVNTLDRLAGQALLAGERTRGMVLLTTGRLTGAMVERGLALGCPIMVSHSGPTTRALALGERRRATLVGYARGPQFSVYSGKARVRGL